jgi:hypothetical protein
MQDMKEEINEDMENLKNKQSEIKSWIFQIKISTKSKVKIEYQEQKTK